MPVLLQWAVLEPAGPLANLAAVRFSAPVRVRTLKFFPTGSRPFKQQRDITAVTEPAALYLDVYFNAHPVAADGKQKPKATNALVATSIAYQGGEVDFSVDMGQEFATRLMIIRGKFEKLSIAVYGDIVSKSSSSSSNAEYVPRQLSLIGFNSLPPYLDPSASIDPTDSAHSLLKLITDSPTLPLITRLMFCLKPSNDDWDKPDFPYLFSDLGNVTDDLDLEKAAAITTRPVSDNIDDNDLRNFAQKLGDTVVDYNDDQAYFLAKVLAQCAPQHPSLVRYILENIDLERMYTVPNLDRPTLLYLVDAAASLDVSKHLNNDRTLQAIIAVKHNPISDQGARRAAARLYERIKGWEVLEDALSNTQASFAKATAHIKDIAMDEGSFGIWLENMMLNRDILDRLTETLPSAHPLPHPPSFLDGNEIFDHNDFIAFLRAFVGVAAVIAVYAWSDSIPVDDCRERALSVIRLWQSVEGYKQVVNHLLLMRQMTYRLEVMLPLDDLPTQAGIDAEHIIKELALQPVSYLRPDFVKVMNNLQAPLNYITDADVTIFKSVASMAHLGVSGCIPILTRDAEELPEAERQLHLRVAVAVVGNVLLRHEDGAQQVLEATWRQGYNTLATYVISHLVAASKELCCSFSLSPSPKKPHTHIAGLFQRCRELIDLLRQLLQLYPPSSPYLISFARATADIFVCTDSADMIYAQESAACAAAHCARQSCIVAVASLISSRALEGTWKSASTVLRALLSHGSTPGNHDAAHHMVQVFWLIDHVLPYVRTELWMQEPEDQRIAWVRNVLTSILPELETFYSLQENENKMHLIRRFREIDRGDVGVAEWLMLVEQQALAKSISLAKTSGRNSAQVVVAHWQISNSLYVLSSMVQKSSSTSEWASSTLLTDSENSTMLQFNLHSLLSLDYFYEAITQLVNVVAESIRKDQPKLRIAILSHIFRQVRCGHPEVLRFAPGLFNNSDALLLDKESAVELGDAMEVIAARIQSMRAFPDNYQDILFDTLDALTPLDKSRSVMVFRGLREDSMAALTQWLTKALPLEKKTKLEALVLRWTVAGSPRPIPTIIPSNYQFDFPLQKWEELLSSPVPVPSTPKRRSPAQTAEMVGMISVSPPNALLRSPEVKGLTKVYANNDFRQLRQQSSGRQNTSRLPSMHVDDFEQGAQGGPTIVPLNLSGSPPSPITFTSPQRPMAIDHMLPMNPNFYHQQQ